jgi:aspartyl/asparaginyl beta-hydroxylase (cupin superfamily)
MDKEVDMYLDEADKQKLAALLSEAKKKYRRSALERLEEAFAISIGAKQPDNTGDPLQGARDFFFPGLTAKPWHETGEFPMCAKLEQTWEVIRDELKYALDNKRGFQHYLRRETSQQTDSNSEVPKEWKALYLKEHTEEFPESRAMCPETTRIIMEEPRVENYVIFSALDPGGHITPHHATYNWTFNIHLGLIVPDNCALRVGKDEPRRWEEGKCLVFDGSFEHEAWNRGDFTRFILLIAIFHPDLTDIEISLLKQVNLDLAKADVAHDIALREGKKQLEDKRWWV